MIDVGGSTANIGQHRVRSDGDILAFHWKGPISRDDIATARKLLAATLAEFGTSFMVSNMTDCTVFEPGARKYLAEWSREGTDKVTGTAIYGVNFAMRTLVTLALNAVKFIGNYDKGDTAFVKDEAEALRWIAGRRASFREVAPSGLHDADE